jgi:hypothetical protein
MSRVKIVMLKDAIGCDETETGVNLGAKTYHADIEYDVCRSLAACFLERGLARPGFLESGLAGREEAPVEEKQMPAPENKVMSRPENKKAGKKGHK